MYLQNNDLFGTIPVSVWESALFMTDLVLQNNRFNGSIPNLMQNNCHSNTRNYVNNIFDISNNRFSGDIPEWIPLCFGQITANLSYNMFTNSQPFMLGGWHTANALDLSHNSLTGFFFYIQMYIYYVYIIYVYLK